MESNDSKDRIEKERLEKVENQLTRILYYLENDPTTNTKGVINKLDDMGQKLDGLLEREKIYLTKAGTWGAIAAIVVGVFYEVGKFILSKWA